MAVYRSAMGKSVDMGAILAKNEKTRAVGNMSVNARGDTIDAHGRIVEPVTSKVNEAYGKTVGNRSAHAVKNTPESQTKIELDMPIEVPELTQHERELDEFLEDDIEVEKIKQEEIKKATKEEIIWKKRN
jgi:hypothetical protein